MQWGANPIPHYAALLRAVNVGGHGNLPMADLRAFATELGLGNVRTLLQSGNLVFETRKQPRGTLERMLETEAEKRLGLRTEFLVRTADELQSLIAHNPFPDAAKNDPGHLLVGFLKSKVTAARVDDLRSAIVGREVVAAYGDDLYFVYPDGVGRSRLTTALIARKLGTAVTGRNWNTVLKLFDLVHAEW